MEVAQSCATLNLKTGVSVFKNAPLNYFFLKKFLHKNMYHFENAPLY